MPAHPTLLLIGHGSARYPEAGALLHRHAETLRRQGHTVAVGFLNGTPTVAEALAATTPPHRAVPFFMEDGYFTRVAIPGALNRPDIPVCPPIGLHPSMPALLERQALAACGRLRLAPADTAVLVIGHGSATAPGQPLALHRHTDTLAATGHFARVAAACLEEPPFVADVLAGLRNHPVIALGWFANLGGHAQDDVPTLLQAERRARDSTGALVQFAGNVTEDPAIPAIILDQAAPSQGG